MSDSVSKDTENENKIVISPEDTNAALDFWRHFDIPMPKSLQDAVDAFSKDVTFENQQRVKLEITKAIATTDHEAFNDEMFTKIKEECAAVSFEMEFDKDFEETATEQKE